MTKTPATNTPAGAPGVPAGGGPITAVGNAGPFGAARSGCTRRCRSGQFLPPERTVWVKPGFLKITLTGDAACRWYRPFAFGDQGGDWFTGRAERYLDDPGNWPTSADCPAKIREIAANPRPQDRDTH